MSIIWVQPILIDAETKCKNCGTLGEHYCPADVAREFEYRCDYCSELVDELFDVEDVDASVGYRNRQEVCKKCLENPRMYEDRYAARCDRDYERFKEEGF